MNQGRLALQDRLTDSPEDAGNPLQATLVWQEPASSTDTTGFAEPISVDSTDTAVDVEEQLLELRAGLKDEEQAQRVIPDRLEDADLPEGLVEVFLREALSHSSVHVRRQAARELDRRGLLERVVLDTLLSLTEDGDVDSARGHFEAAVLGIALLDFEELPDEYVRQLVAAVAAVEDAEVSAAAEVQLGQLGVEAVPVLLDLVLDEDSSREVRRIAAKRLGALVGTREVYTTPSNGYGAAPAAPAEPAAGWEMPFEPGGPRAPAYEPYESVLDAHEFGEVGPTMPAPVPPATAGDETQAEPEHVIREVSEGEANEVTVYYGTNRIRLTPPASTHIPIWIWLLFAVASAGVMPWRRWFGADVKAKTAAGNERGWWRWTRYVPLASLVLVVLSLASHQLNMYSAHVEFDRGIVFGNKRDPQHRVHYGTCRVSLPPRSGRRVGELSLARPGFENADVDVIVQETASLQEATFFQELEQQLADLEPDLQDCLVFVHGYNVDFREAAARTAQLHVDLEFPGVSVFYSWPSRGTLLGYPADANEVSNSAGLIKQFLYDVATRTGARRVHVIAHSKGGDAVSWAIRDLDPQEQLFHQLILAAPDIDADTFREEIAPRLSRSASRTTLYCSANDWALLVSNRFNDYWRAGDSSGNRILVDAALETIDASQINTSSIGHSYYGDCIPVIEDIRQLIAHDTAPEQRRGPSYELRLSLSSTQEEYWKLIPRN